MNTEARVFKNTAYQIFGKIIISGLGVVATAFLSRFLGTNLYGEYSITLSYVGFVAIFADLGLSSLLVREVAAGRANHEYFKHIFGLRAFSAFAVLLLGVILVFFFPYNNLVKLGVIIASLGTFLSLLSSVIWSYFQGKVEFQNVVYSQIANSVAVVVLTIAGVYLKLPMIFFVVVFLLGNLVSFSVSLDLAKIKIFFMSVSRKVYADIIKESWSFGVGAIITVAYFKIDSIILSLFYNPASTPDVGIYAIAYKIFEVIVVFGGTFTAAMYPYFSKKISDKDFSASFRKFFLYTLVISVLGGLFLLVFSKPLVLLLGGGSYINASNSLIILSAAAVATILAGFFLNIAVSVGKQVLVAKYALAALVINVILNFIFIPRYSYIAASWITVITQLFILITNAYVAYRFVKKS